LHSSFADARVAHEPAAEKNSKWLRGPREHHEGAQSGTPLGLVAGVIGVTLQDCKCAIHLLEQHNSRELMGQGHLTE
jgi:hypothetical protein